ncbi:MAG: glycosyltransferase [Bacteroidota bacterium]|nr:glycosyltransferase [Bacteroidota bacterium]
MINNLIYILIVLLGLNYLAFLFRIVKGLNKLRTNEPSYNMNKTAMLINNADDIEEEPAANLFISIIIPFHDEKNNILNSLKSTTSQNLPKDSFEVIYINDNSSDGGDILLKENIETNNVYLYNNFPAMNNKKAAIEYGISKAKGEIIVLSDADCIQQPNWINMMLSFLDDKTGFIAGPVEFYSNSSAFSNLQQLEFSSLIITGAGLIGSNMPAICNGANILFRKRLFYEVNGYHGNENISSGDDVFLMQKIAKLTDYEIKFCNSAESIVRTYPQKTVAKFFNQRKRWAGKSIAFINKKLVVILALIFLFYVGLFISPLLIINNINLLFLFLTAGVLKALSEFIVLKSGKEVIPLTISFRYFVLAEILHIPYIVFSTVYGVFGKKRWE